MKKFNNMNIKVKTQRLANAILARIAKENSNISRTEQYNLAIEELETASKYCCSYLEGDEQQEYYDMIDLLEARKELEQVTNKEFTDIPAFRK